MNDILSEKQYQHEIMDYLESVNGYRIRKATHYDRLFAIDREMLMEFLTKSQPDVMAELAKIFKGDLEETLVNTINQAVIADKSSLVEVLKNGVEISSRFLKCLSELLPLSNCALIDRKR